MTDRRVERTKEWLRSSLLELLREKPLKAVSVRDVLERAEVSRTAFYNHYRDLDDLAQDCWLSRMPYFSPPYPRLADYESPSQACQVLLDTLADELMFFRENASYAREMIDSIGRSIYYLQTEAAHMELLMTQMTTEYGADASYMGLRGNDAARFVIAGQFALIRNWLEDGMTRNIEEMCKMLAYIDFQCTAAVAGHAIEPYFLEAIEAWRYKEQ